MIFNKLFQYPMPNDMFKNNWEEAGEREMARRRTTRGSAQERGHSGSLLSMKLQDCQEHIDESLEPIKMSKEDFLFYLKIIQPLWKDKKRI